MSGDSLAAVPGRRAVNPWIVAITVTLATFMEVLDTTIAVVSLPYIAGDLGVTVDEASWILTTYLVANAIVLPASGWVSGLIGRKRFYMSCVFLFTVSSILCGMAPNLSALLLCRVFQGAGGGGLQPSEQAILLDTFPRHKIGMALAVYGIAILFAPILGPTVGGYITENYNWRWIFYINVPVGCVSLLLTSLVVQDPPWMAEERHARRGRPLDLDLIGLGLIALGLGALEVIYDRGQEDDWFNSRFITILAVVAMISLSTAVAWELRQRRPVLNLRLLKDRNFSVGCVVIYVAFVIVYGSNVLLPQMLQSVFGYDAYTAGLIMSPGGIAVMAVMPVTGYLLGRQVDARWLVFFGMLAVGTASYWAGLLNLQVSPWILVVRRCAQLFGMGFIFAPINVAAYLYLPEHQRTNATGLFNMIRNEGASLGIAIVNVALAQRSQLHQSRLVEGLSPFDPAFVEARNTLIQHFQTTGYDPVTASEMAISQINQFLQQQSLGLSYFDLFWIFSMAAYCAAPLVFFMRRSVTDKGAPVAAH
ncbi:MAG: DHA2 family efflux MFS transporter permease subunit [Thermoguttaceae bacterium]